MRSVKHFRELDVYQGAMSVVMRIFELTKQFPAEEKYALADQIHSHPIGILVKAEKEVVGMAL